MEIKSKWKSRKLYKGKVGFYFGINRNNHLSDWESKENVLSFSEFYHKNNNRRIKKKA